MGEHYPLVIVGAGPAGLSASLNATRHKLSHLVLEKAEIANTVHQYQLRKRVMSEPSKLPLRGQLEFKAGTREEVLEKWNNIVATHNLNIRCGVEVNQIQKDNGIFQICFNESCVTSDRLILAIGLAGTPSKLDVPGEELSHVSYSLADPAAFEGQKILIVGAGDSAIENASALAEKNQVTIVNRRDNFYRAKTANARSIQQSIDSKKIKCFFDSTLAKIEPGQVSINTPDGLAVVSNEYIIIRAGTIPPDKFLENCGIQFVSMDKHALPRVNSQYESDVEGLYLVGSLIGYPLIKHSINQGFEVVEHIMGNPVQPADHQLIVEKLQKLDRPEDENLQYIHDQLPWLRDLSAPKLRELVAESELHVKEKNEIVFKRNDYSDSLFNIIEGSVSLEMEDGKRINLEAGEFFGEFAVLSGRRRNATARARERTLLLETHRNQALKIFNTVPSLGRKLNQVFMLRFLQNMFPECDAAILRGLARNAILQSFKKDEVIFREGDIGDSLHFIRKGQVKISRKIHGRDKTYTYLSAGNYIGEMTALATDMAPRTATVTAAVACETLAISKYYIQGAFGEHPEILNEMRRVADKRHLENMVFDTESMEGEFLDFMLGKGLSDADNVLLIDSDLCISCDNCENACAATHSGYSLLDRKGGESYASIQVPTSCRHCENPLCMSDCPPDALFRNINGEIIIKDSCIGCGNCAKNCPYDVIQMVQEPAPKSFLSMLFPFFKPKIKDEGQLIAAKCDMCSSLPLGPACIRACPTGAAMRVHPTKVLDHMAQHKSLSR